MRTSIRQWAMLAAAFLAMAFGLVRLMDSTSGLSITRTKVGTTPVTVFSKGSQPSPVVVVAHGFAGSQQLMQPFAITLARSGYLVVTYDLLGHGRNGQPLTGDVTKVEGASANLVAELGRVVDFARALPSSDGRIALLGHSMATDVIIRYAIDHPQIAATIAVSMYSPVVTATAPNNLLIVIGGWETTLKKEALRVLSLAAGPGAKAGQFYGDIGAGTGREVIIADHVEHIGVLFSRVSLAAARDWLNRVFDRTIDGPVDQRGLSLVLYFGAVVVIARFAAALLPRIADLPVSVGYGWRRLLLLGLGPALVTPLMLWRVPFEALPIPVGAYLALHFLAFGLLTAAAMLLLRGAPAHPIRGLPAMGKAALAITSVIAFCGAAIYLPIDVFVTSFVPTAGRLPLVAAMAAALLPYFLADEWLTRGEKAPRGAYPFTKLCFLVSLALAIALNLGALFFLVIIVPVILVFFTMFGLFSGWIYKRTRHPVVAAVANALLFAWAIAVTFPMLA